MMMLYIKLIKNHVLKLDAIDIIVFSVLINLNFYILLKREFQVFICILILRRYLLKHSITKYLESIIFISGRKLRFIVFLNLIINNLIFILISLFMWLIDLVSSNYFIENIMILNALITISVFIKYSFPYRFINSYFILNILQQIIYFVTFFVFYYLPIEYQLVMSFFLYFYLFKTTNRTLIYDDINK